MFGQNLPDVAGGVLALVGAHHLLDAAVQFHRAVVDPHRRLAQSCQEFVGVAGEHQDSGSLNQSLQPGLGLFEEFRVDRADALVEQQYLRVDTGDHAHRQADPHTGSAEVKRTHEELVERILHAGLAYTEAVDPETSLVICNEQIPEHGKGFQARELGVPTVSDEQFMRSVGAVADGVGIEEFEQSVDQGQQFALF